MMMMMKELMYLMTLVVVMITITVRPWPGGWWGRGERSINDDKDVDGLTLGDVGEGSYDIDDVDVECFDNVDCVGEEVVQEDADGHDRDHHHHQWSL